MAVNLQKSEPAKRELMRILREQGYGPYARLLQYFDIYITSDPEVVGYMIPNKAVIVLNGGLNVNQVSTIVRHEILHEYLTHMQRGQQVESEMKMGSPELSNIAGDYEISNVGYTESDKAIARAIRLNGVTLRGLVTEDQYPGWKNWTFEQMYKQLLQDAEKDENTIKNAMSQQQQSGQLSQEKVDELTSQLDELQKQEEENDSQQDDTNQTSRSSSEEDTENTPATSKTDDADSDKLDKIQDEIEDIASRLQNVEQETEGQVFDTPQQQKEKSDLQKRVERIKEILQDEKERQAAITATQQVRQQERVQAIRQQELNKQKQPLSKFRLSLNRFIQDQVRANWEESEDIFDAGYLDRGYIVPGEFEVESKNVPLINVYWDVSGSFSNPNKTESAAKAIGTLNQYVQRGDIQVKTYYFADRVSDTRAGAGGGTDGDAVIKHIRETKPTNVIVITDNDCAYSSQQVTVPGAVWMLVYENHYIENRGLFVNLKGKQETRIYQIEYNA